MAKELLFALKVEGLKTELERLEKLNQNIGKLKEEVKTYAETDKELSEKKKIQLKAEQEAYRNLQNEVSKRAKIEQESVRTLGKMRNELSLLNKQIENTQVGTKRFKELNAEAKKLSNEIRTADEAGGRFTTNIGNYKRAVIDAFQAMGVNVAGMTDNINTAVNVSKAFAVGISAVSDKARSAQKATELWNKAQASNNIFTKAATYLQWAWNAALAANPIGVIVVSALALVGALTALAFWYKDSTGKIKEQTKAYTDLKNAQDIVIENEQRELEIIKEIGGLTNSELLKSELDILKEKEIGFQIELDALDQIENKTKDQISRQKELPKLYKENGLQITLTTIKYSNAIRVENQKISEEKKRFDEEEKKRLEEAQHLLIDRRHEEYILEQTQQELEFDAINKMLALKDEIAESPLTELFKLPDEEAYEDQSTALIELMRKSAEDGLRLLQEFDNDKIKEYDRDLKALEDAHRLGLTSTEEFENGKLELRKIFNKKILIETANLLNGLAEIFDKESKAGKAAAVASTAINTYLAAMEAFKSGMKYGGIPLAIASAAVATAFGLKQIQKIVATKQENQPQYARGVIGLKGAGTETSDSITARLSKGESVITAKATKVFAPVLAQMEMAVGNRPNLQLGNRRFAGGLIGMNPNTDINLSNDRIIKDAIAAFGMIPVIVSENDITTTQARVRTIKVKSNL